LLLEHGGTGRRDDTSVEIGMRMSQHRRRRQARVDNKSTNTNVREPEVLRIALLGGFRVSVGTRTIEEDAWHMRKAANLVKLLALAPGHLLHREQAMDALWPDLARRAASNNLRQVLHAARGVLDPVVGSRYVASENGSLILGQEGLLWVDAEVFGEAAIAARRAKVPSAYEAAIEQYAGELLPKDHKEAWTHNRREELRRLYLTLLLDLATLYEGREEYERGIGVLRRALSEDPSREATHADLMRLYAHCGRRREAALQYELLVESLSREPGPEARRLYERIRAGSFPQESAGADRRESDYAGRHNLPASSTSFVGREREIAEARRMLSMTRLLTLTGAGGSGKTRLAVEAAGGLAGAYPDGVWMAELAPLSEPGLVPQAVAHALGISEQPGRPLLGTLTEALRDKELLLVMDNCEHLIQASSNLAEKLLSSCPRLRILATSREPLGVGGEAVRQVGPLSLPETRNGGLPSKDLMGCEAVRLFVERASVTAPGFDLTEGNAGAVVRVCRRLDGIPLAIELAAAQLGDLAVEQVAGRLEGSLDLLQSSGRTVEPKQQTLRATLDWSHKLLVEDERVLFGRLSVFAGEWTLEAAEQVCSGPGIEQDEILDRLGDLVDKSLVVVAPVTDGAMRYRMLEPIRQYAREKLEESGQAYEARRRHVAFFLALAEEAALELDGPRQRLWVERLDGEHDNLREALSWILESSEGEMTLRLGAALWRFWFARGYLSEGIRWMERVLAGSGPAPPLTRVKALEGLGWLVQVQGEIGRAETAYEEMLELSWELDDKGNVATALNSLGTLSLAHGDYGRARSLLEENLAVLRRLEEEGDAATTPKRFHTLNLLGALAINEENDYAQGEALWEESLAAVQEVGDTFHVGATLSNLGYTALMQGNYERATMRCEEALALAYELGSAGVEIIPETLVNSGLVALLQGDYDRGRKSFEEALVMGQNAGRKATVINSLEAMASLAGALGEPTLSARLWGAAEAAREATAIVLPPGERTLHEPYLVSARTRLGERKWDETLSEGRAMSLEEASEYVLSEERTDPPAAPVPERPPAGELMSALTLREEEVAALVALGFTNREISTRLSISERTAGNHVGRILKKLGLGSRTQIATWATEHRLSAHDPD
jgi:predicted ATPase/DNA-binding SARP family transcriptional activator/DNA-binding CsgD family transcriptional regulator